MDWKNLDQFTLGIRQLSIKRDLNFESFLEDLEYGKQKQKKVFVAFMCCPDYSYKVDNNGWCTYTHSSLRYGPGMMCYAYSEAILELAEISNKTESFLRIVLFYGDNEANDKNILEKLALTKKEFKDRVNCNISSGENQIKMLLQYYFPENKYLQIQAIGLSNTLYHNENVEIAQKKIKTVEVSEIELVAEKRRIVIESMYGLKFPKDSIEILDKAREQVLDRMIVGTALCNKRLKGNLYSLVSLTPPSLISFFNFGNKEKVPILRLGN